MRIGRLLAYNRGPGLLGLLNESRLRPDGLESQVSGNGHSAAPGVGGNVLAVLPVVYPPDMDVSVNREAIVTSCGIEVWAQSIQLAVAFPGCTVSASGVKVVPSNSPTKCWVPQPTVTGGPSGLSPFEMTHFVDFPPSRGVEITRALPNSALHVVRIEFTCQLPVLEVVRSENRELVQCGQSGDDEPRLGIVVPEQGGLTEVLVPILVWDGRIADDRVGGIVRSPCHTIVKTPGYGLGLLVLLDRLSTGQCLRNGVL